MTTRSAPLDRIRQEIRALAGYYDVQPSVEVKLDQNENPYDFPDELKLKTFARARAERWERYYEVRPAALVDGLAELAGWPADGIIVGNGSNELLMATILATAAVGGRMLSVQPSFLLYGRLCRLLGAELVGVPLDAQLVFDVATVRKEIERTDPALVVLCSPNNPTGSSIEPEALQSIADGCSGVVLVDEAYHEFSGRSFRALLDRCDNVVLLRTFSKAMSLAGVRVGYLLGSASIVGEISKAKLPFSLNPISCQAALTALGHQPTLRARVDAVVAERERVLAALRERADIEVFPSDANFILLKAPNRGDAVIDALAEHGVLVRKLRGHPLLDDSMRVTVGTPDQNDRFLAALDVTLASTARGQ